MTISYSGRGGTNSADVGAANITAAYSSANAGGSLSVVAAGWGDADNTFNISSVVDSNNNPYLPARVKTRNATATFSVQLWYQWGIRAGSNTVQINFSNAATTFRRIGIAEYVSTNGSWWKDPLSTNNGATGSSTALNSGSFTPSQNNALIVGVGGINGGTLSVTGGFSLRQTMAVDVLMEDLIQTSAASVAAVMTGTVSSDWMIQGAAFLDVEAPPPYIRIPPPFIIYLAGWAANRRSAQENVGPPTNAPADPANFAFAAGDATVKVSPSAGVATMAIAAQTIGAIQVAPNINVASLTFTANDAQGSIKPSAGVATMTIVANTVSSMQIAPNVGVATFAVNAQTPSVSIAPHADFAPITFTANSATTKVSASANVATLTIAGLTAQISEAPHTGNAAFTFTANNATVTTGTSAAAGVATLTFTANNATDSIAPHADVTALTFTANAATTKISPSVNVAPFSFTANNATVQTSVVANAGVASWSIVGQSATTKVSPTSNVATFSFTANNVQASEAPHAGVATFAINAQTPSVSIAPHAGNALFTFTANNAAAIIGTFASPGVATMAITANGATIKVSSPVGNAAFSFTANNPTVLTGTVVTPGVAPITLTANNPSARVSVSTTTAPITFTANNATVSTASQTQAPAGVANWTMAALNATVTTTGGNVSVDAGFAPIGLVAYNGFAGAGETNTAWGMQL